MVLNEKVLKANNIHIKSQKENKLTIFIIITCFGWAFKNTSIREFFILLIEFSEVSTFSSFIGDKFLPRGKGFVTPDEDFFGIIILVFHIVTLSAKSLQTNRTKYATKWTKLISNVKCNKTKQTQLDRSIIVHCKYI